MVTTIEATLYRPLNLSVNGETAGALERTYQTVENRKHRRKFTAEDTALLNALYVERMGDGSYARTVAQLQEDFRAQTGKSISRTSVYNKIHQTRRSRSRALVPAGPTAIEVYNGRVNGVAAAMPRSIIAKEELEGLQNTSPEEGVALYQDLDGRTQKVDLSALKNSLEARRDRDADRILGQTRFYKNNGDWGEFDNIYRIGMLWSNVEQWSSRIKDPELRDLVLKVYLPVAVLVQSELVREYTLASKERNPSLLKKVFNFVSGR